MKQLNLSLEFFDQFGRAVIPYYRTVSPQALEEHCRKIEQIADTTCYFGNYQEPCRVLQARVINEETGEIVAEYYQAA